jgi:hypothetical protein
VIGGKTSDLGIVTWKPKRVGATIFGLGSPNRKANEFRHGDDFWAPAPAPKLGYPTPVWGGQVEFPLEFPDGMTYTIGKSRWAIDWNYVLPSAPDRAGTWQPCTGKILFELAKAPDDAAAASLYLGCAGDDGGHVIVSINGVNLGPADGVSAAPQPINARGSTPPASTMPALRSTRSKRLPQRSLKIEAIQIHHLIPRRNEIFHEFFRAVRTGVDFCHSTQAGISNNDQINARRRPLNRAGGAIAPLKKGGIG